MNTKIDQRVNADQLKLSFAAILVLGGILGFYYFDEISNLFRVGGFILMVGSAIGFFWATAKGKETVAFLREAQVEVKKVVWPTRQETLQTTFFVLVVVVIFGILLWLLDLLLSSVVNALI